MPPTLRRMGRDAARSPSRSGTPAAPPPAPRAPSRRYVFRSITSPSATTLSANSIEYTERKKRLAA
eukprot:365083-Chlamydomonas_euryale.AAC.36